MPGIATCVAQEEGGVEGGDRDREVAGERDERGTDGTRRRAIRTAPSASRPDARSRRVPPPRRARARRSTRRNNRASRRGPPPRGAHRAAARTAPPSASTAAPAGRSAGDAERGGGRRERRERREPARRLAREKGERQQRVPRRARQSQRSRRRTWPAPIPMRKRRADLGARRRGPRPRGRPRPPAKTTRRPDRATRTGIRKSSIDVVSGRQRRDELAAGGVDAAVGAEADAERALGLLQRASRGPSRPPRASPRAPGAVSKTEAAAGGADVRRGERPRRARARRPARSAVFASVKTRTSAAEARTRSFSTDALPRRDGELDDPHPRSVAAGRPRRRRRAVGRQPSQPTVIGQRPGRRPAREGSRSARR